MVLATYILTSTFVVPKGMTPGAHEYSNWGIKWGTLGISEEGKPEILINPSGCDDVKPSWVGNESGHFDFKRCSFATIVRQGDDDWECYEQDWHDTYVDSE